MNELPSIRTVELGPAARASALPFDENRSRAGEQYRIIRTKIIQHPLQPRLIVVTSPTSGDGKTVSSVNIAGALSLLRDTSVLLVDGDLRRCSVSALLGIPVAPGLADVLSGACEFSEAVVRLEEFPNLCVLPAGRVRANPTELLGSSQWKSLCESFRKQFHHTIVDAPPVNGVADYDLLQDLCDGVILIVRPDHTDRTLCVKAADAVPKSKLLGAVVNCVDEWFLWKSHEYYYGPVATGDEL